MNPEFKSKNGELLLLLLLLILLLLYFMPLPLPWLDNGRDVIGIEDAFEEWTTMLGSEFDIGLEEEEGKEEEEEKRVRLGALRALARLK